jgi:integrase
VAGPARLATRLDPTPREFRRSYGTHLRAAGIDDADLALVAGHAVETMVSVYTARWRKATTRAGGRLGDLRNWWRPRRL